MPHPLSDRAQMDAKAKRRSDREKRELRAEINRLRAEQTINGHTLHEVVARYLAELDNPAPDYGMRQVYRDWMREFLQAKSK